MAVKKTSTAADAVKKTTAPKKSRKAVAEPSMAFAATTHVAPDEIARRAYEIFLERGAEHGRDLEHWLAAERELGTQTSSMN